MAINMKQLARVRHAEVARESAWQDLSLAEQQAYIAAKEPLEPLGNLRYMTEEQRKKHFRDHPGDKRNPNRGAGMSWWQTQTTEQRKKYCRDHPNSTLCNNGHHW